jgi:ribonuclease Y
MPYTTLYILIALVLGTVLGVGIAIFYIKKISSITLISARKEADFIIQEARKEASCIAKEASVEAKDIIYKAATESEKELREQRNELIQLEKRLLQRAEGLDRRLDQAEKKEQDFFKRDKELRNREKLISKKEEQTEDVLKEQTATLERLACLNVEEAKNELMIRIEEKARFDAAKLARRIEDEAKDMANRKAKEIISLAVQRYASDFISDATVTVVPLPSDKMKGRIIGREGRNIRAIEAATGIELIIDDTPDTVILSSFDPIRREVARLALERLISDGRIHPARIEEIVDKIKKEVELAIKEEGEKAIFDLGLHGIHPEIVKLIGRLKFRASFAQNVLQHSREVAYLASIMANELGVDAKLAKRAGLLHDIGKAVDHEVEGSHQAIGAKIAKKYGENSKVVNAIEVHHGEGEPMTVEAVLVAAADALSAARPGARKESLENYLKRLEKLEEIANSFRGVDKSYAIQAGREIRIVVKPEEVSDEFSAQITRELAKKIEDELTYPGQIKVTVIREARFVGYAK